MQLSKYTRLCRWAFAGREVVTASIKKCFLSSPRAGVPVQEAVYVGIKGGINAKKR